MHREKGERKRKQRKAAWERMRKKVDEEKTWKKNGKRQKYIKKKERARKKTRAEKTKIIA